jgi:hypothetical protein
MAHSNFGVRFRDGAEEPPQDLMPIEGYEKKQLLTLEDAVRPIKEPPTDLLEKVTVAKRNSRTPANGLYSDESAAIHLYTMEWSLNQPSLYTLLNQKLRSTSRETLIPWFPYLKLFLTALYKLPSFKGTIWRGVLGNLSAEYVDDRIWWGVSSCTTAIDVMKDFVGDVGVRTLFNIECINGKSIKTHSYNQVEHEVILMPGTYLKVVGKWSPSTDVHIIHLREATPPYQTIAPPYDVTLPFEGKSFSVFSL